MGSWKWPNVEMTTALSAVVVGVAALFIAIDQSRIASRQAEIMEVSAFPNQLHCRYCHRFEIPGTEGRPCNKCGGAHQACKRCFKFRTKVVGTFPDYEMILKDCPERSCEPCFRPLPLPSAPIPDKEPF